ncbi:MAG TPA: tRNA pseudouridine(38-40) synthase TruA [Clostridiaceae bacterium]|nr:tRNA pseudouridine(38-40) synthase TruA [Clostridiaceae bacterium]
MRQEQVRNIALLVEFDGTEYAGWQRQKNVLAVQEVLERAVKKIMKHDVTLTGCSRTDAGVHAAGHVSNFKTSNPIPTDKIPIALATALPDDVAVLDATEVPTEFNARYAARGKRYAYQIWNHPRPSALRTRFTLHESRELDVAAMEKAAAYFVGKHDFKAFMATGSSAKTTVREIFTATVKQDGYLIRIVVEGGGFLYNMMRIISGTLLYVGLGKIETDAVPSIIAAGRRQTAGKTLPAKGLCLERVWFDAPLFFHQEGGLL